MHRRGALYMTLFLCEHPDQHHGGEPRCGWALGVEFCLVVLGVEARGVISTGDTCPWWREVLLERVCDFDVDRTLNHVDLSSQHLASGRGGAVVYE